MCEEEFNSGEWMTVNGEVLAKETEGEDVKTKVDRKTGTVRGEERGLGKKVEDGRRGKVVSKGERLGARGQGVEQCGVKWVR